MTPLLIALGLVLALGVGVLLGWLLHAFRTGTADHAEQTSLAARAAAAEASAAAAQAELARRAELEQERAARAAEQERRREERESRDQAVLRTLAPVQETLTQLRQKVDELERERSTQYGALAEQLRRAHESDESLRATTATLAGALRSGSARGAWGEVQLRRIVEAAGLTRHIDFDVQTATESDVGAGRPDMLIHLPGGRSIAVDAKAPLAAYLEASTIDEAETGAAAARRADLLAQHVKAVRAHVDALAKKQYWRGLAESPEFVVCFIPSESLLSAALSEDPGLLEHAFDKRVALASPVNLWAVLKTVAYTWTQQGVSDEAKELHRLGVQLYERLGGLGRHADGLRRGIERTVDEYNKLIGTLESRVLVSARRFPGIDEAALNALDAPRLIEQSPRVLTAPELTGEA